MQDQQSLKFAGEISVGPSGRRLGCGRHIMRVAFGTFLGMPQLSGFMVTLVTFVAAG
jgi:hypothetical protein